MLDKKIKLLSKTTIDSTLSPQSLQKLLLKNRHIKTSLPKFLKPPFPKADFLDFKPAISFLKKYQDKQIFIYADYDVDGNTSATPLWQTKPTLISLTAIKTVTALTTSPLKNTKSRKN